MASSERGWEMDIGLLVLRLVVGLTLTAHGSQKLFGWFGGGGLDGTAGHLEQLGFRPRKLFAAGTGLAEARGRASLSPCPFTPLVAPTLVCGLVAWGVCAPTSEGAFSTQRRVEYA